MALFFVQESYENILTVGLDSSALFDMTEDYKILAEQGFEAYQNHMKQNEHVPMKLGHAAEFVRTANMINDASPNTAYVISLFTNDDLHTAIRIMNSLAHHKLSVGNCLFANSFPQKDYLATYGIQWFMSAFKEDVKNAHDLGIAANLVDSPLSTPEETIEARKILEAAYLKKPLRDFTQTDLTSQFNKAAHFVYDLDRVLFSHESDEVAATQGLEAYFAHEKKYQYVPIGPGPFMNVAKTTSNIIQTLPADKEMIFQSVCTRRSFSAAQRALVSLREHNIAINGPLHFTGTPVKQNGAGLNVGISKGDIVDTLKKTTGHEIVFLDDSTYNVDDVRNHAFSGHVPSDPSAKALGDLDMRGIEVTALNDNNAARQSIKQNNMPQNNM